MTPRKTSLSAIAIAPPSADVADVAAEVHAQFGLTGDYDSVKGLRYAAAGIGKAIDELL